jgi:hypothetical protein
MSTPRAATGSTGTVEIRGEREEVPIRRGLTDAGPQDAPAWELVGAGRYMPRRIRGSFRGRELG